MSDGDVEGSRKTSRSIGSTVVILGLLSLMFLGDAGEEFVVVTLLGIGLCVVTGVWLAAKPSVAIGVAAGVSLAILGVIDFVLGAEAEGLAFIAPLIDFGFAIRVFVGCPIYARASRGTGSADQADSGDWQ